MYKYFYHVNLKARWGSRKPLGEILQGTLRIDKIIILEIAHGSGGLENGFYAKNGGKINIFRINSIISENDSIVCCEKRSKVLSNSFLSFPMQYTNFLAVQGV